MFKFIFFLLLWWNVADGQVKPDSVWLNQKYSMFIHWGLYSELGGVWNGQPVTRGYSEQIQSHGGIFGDWYAAVVDRFNPVAWNADSVVLLAKKAGMRSVVVTSKHHDGFCMYHSQYTDYNIVDATPFGRDVLKELSEACSRQGMRLGVYFSLIDWHFPEAYPISSHNADPATPAHHAYNMKQVEEILTHYGPISEIWFDMGALTPEQSRELYGVVGRLQPQCMVSGRLGNDCGDFSVMADNEYPDYQIGEPWQTAASFFDETWGYRSWQERGDVHVKAGEKIRSLIKVVSRGGNYLLNIGPDGNGRVVPFEREVLLEIGRWLEKYGEGIYGAMANPFDGEMEWGDVTARARSLYLFIEKRPASGTICLPGLRGGLKEATWIGGGKIEAVLTGDGVELRLGKPHKTDGPVEVIRLDFDGDFTVASGRAPVAGKVLTPYNALLVYAYSSMDYYSGFRSTIAYDWRFEKSGRQVCPVVTYTEDEAGRELALVIDDVRREVVLAGGVESRLPVKSGSVRWGKVSLSRPHSGVFGNMPDEPAGVEVAGFEYGHRYELPLPERQYLLLSQEVVSDKAQEVLVEIGRGNGIEVVLNGEIVAKHSSQKGEFYQVEKVLLPLKAGQNRLVLKLYNRFEKKLCYSLNPFVDQRIYHLEMEPISLGADKIHRCTVSPARPESRHSDMRLGNLRIRLK